MGVWSSAIGSSGRSGPTSCSWRACPSAQVAGHALPVCWAKAMCLGRQVRGARAMRPTAPRETAGAGSGPQPSSPSPGPKRTRQDAPRVPKQMGPSCSSEGDSEASTVPRGSFRSGALGSGQLPPPSLGLCVSGTTGQRHSRLPCRNKALCSGSFPGGGQRLCLHTGFPGAASLCPRQPWRDFFLRAPTTEELRAAAKGRLRRGSTSPAGWQSAQVHYRGRDLRRDPRASTKSNGSSRRAVTVSSPPHGCTKGTEPRRAPTPQPEGREQYPHGDRRGKGASGTSPCSPWPGEPFHPHGSKAAGCSQASLDQEDLFV